MAYVMIIDDDEDFALAAAATLRSQGHEVSVDLSTSSAMEHIKKRVPDVAILDVMFPEDTCAGFNMARALHAAGEPLSNIPILMLTAVNAKFPLGFSQNDIDDTWMPVTDFIERPIDLDVLTKKVSRLAAMAADDSAE